MECENDLDAQDEDEDHAAGWAVSEWCRRPGVVHHEVHVEHQEVVKPVGDWRASDQSVCDIEHDAKSIPKSE